MTLPADFNLPQWMMRNIAIEARLVDGVLVSVHAQAYNWHLTLSDDEHSYFDDY